MKKLTSSSMFFSLCAFLITSAPLLDMTTRSVWGWGEPDFPDEKDFE